MPDTGRMWFAFIELSGFVLLIYMIGTFFVLWTFGKAVCARIGNVLYLVFFGLSTAMGAGIIIAWGEDTLWILNWLVQCLAGMFLVFCPLNSVDCFIFFPPFRSFSLNGLWIVIVWLIADLLFCLILGWTVAVFLHPVSFLSGLLLASFYLRIPFVGRGPGDLTLWQWLKGQNPDEALAWKDSWSAKRQEKIRQQQTERQHEESLIQKEEEFIRRRDKKDTEETIGILCQCGHIVYVPKQFQGTSIQCEVCRRHITLQRPTNRAQDLMGH